MEKSQFIEHGASLFTIDGLRAAVEGAASSPKVAAGVAAGTASMGAMAKLEMIQSAVGTCSLCVGLMTGCVVLCIQSIKLIRVYRSWTPNKPDSGE